MLSEKLEIARQRKSKKIGKKYRQADLARAVGVSTAAVALWFDGKTKSLSHKNIVKVAAELDVSERWLDGTLPLQKVSNLELVTDDVICDDENISEYHYFAESEGSSLNDEFKKYSPSDYVTFKRSWLNKKGYEKDKLCVIYARGNSMENRICDNDIVLVRMDKKKLIHNKIFVFDFGDEIGPRIKRISLDKKLNRVELISDNDPDGSKKESISMEMAASLTVIGQAVWVGGDLN